MSKSSLEITVLFPLPVIESKTLKKKCCKKYKKKGKYCKRCPKGGCF